MPDGLTRASSSWLAIRRRCSTISAITTTCRATAGRLSKRSSAHVKPILTTRTLETIWIWSARQARSLKPENTTLARSNSSLRTAAVRIPPGVSGHNHLVSDRPRTAAPQWQYSHLGPGTASDDNVNVVRACRDLPISKCSSALKECIFEVARDPSPAAQSALPVQAATARPVHRLPVCARHRPRPARHA